MANAAWNSYSDFYQRSNYSAFPQEHRKSQGRLPFQMIMVEQGTHNFIDPMLDETVLALPLSVERECSLEWTMRERIYRQEGEVGQMLVLPANTESKWQVKGRRTILVLAFPNSCVQNVLGTLCPQRIGDAFWKLAESTWRDPFVEGLMHRLWDVSAGKDVAGNYLADGLLTSILSQMLISAGTNLDPNPAIALPQWRLRRVTQFVHEHLSEEICLDDLASAAGLSRRHFARSFQQETGETPHRWLMQFRLDKAKEFLAATNDPIVDIAENCGFASQSHFTTVLKQSTGMTPHRWRQRTRQ